MTKSTAGQYTRVGRTAPAMDAVDRQLLTLLQENCKQPLASLGKAVGMSAPSVMERIRKLEDAGIITGYSAIIAARQVGLGITAFIGVSTNHPRAMKAVADEISSHAGVLECHHVTGGHSLMLKVKTATTDSLEELLDALREIDGVSGTETMIVLSTHVESPRINLDTGGA